MEIDATRVTAGDLDKMTPQERADAINGSVVTSWDQVDVAFRSKIERREADLAEHLPARN